MSSKEKFDFDSILMDYTWFISLPDDSSKDILTFMENSHYSTWLEIDLGAIRNNVKRIQQITQRPVISVIKANAYGHGTVEVARSVLAAGSTMLAVARIEEALELKEKIPGCAILVLGYTSPDRICDAASSDIRVTVYDEDMIACYTERLRKSGLRLKVHLKIETGMGRLGVFPETGVELVERLISADHVELEGIFTHFARADEPDRPETNEQIQRFDRVIEELHSKGIRIPMIHAANSAGALYFPTARYDAVRCGIAIYGLYPSALAPLPEGFRPALSWKSRLTSIKQLPPGHGISYNHRYVTSASERIGAIATGYADGLRRRIGNYALVHGQRVPVVGAVCMDQCMLQMDTVPNAVVGDEVVMIGRQGNATITAEELADAWGTIDYEVVCGFSARLPRVYVDRTNP